MHVHPKSAMRQSDKKISLKDTLVHVDRRTDTKCRIGESGAVSHNKE